MNKIAIVTDSTAYIPKDFVEYIRNEVQDYDSSKSKQFYLFEVE